MANDINDLAGTARRLRADLDSARPSTPAEIVWAYQDSEVRETLVKHIEAGEKILAVDVLVPDIVLRLRRVYFQFCSPQGVDVTHPGVLVQVAEDNTVSQIIDPFLLTSNNKAVLAQNENGTFPLSFKVPLLRSTAGVESLKARFAEFIGREGLEGGFQAMRKIIGGIGEFSSGTCVITTYPIPTIKNPGDPEGGVGGLDAEDQEDDNNFSFSL